MTKFKCLKRHDRYELMIEEAIVGDISRAWSAQWRETPWFAANHLGGRAVGHYRTLRDARTAVEEDERKEPEVGK